MEIPELKYIKSEVKRLLYDCNNKIEISEGRISKVEEILVEII